MSSTKQEAETRKKKEMKTEELPCNKVSKVAFHEVGWGWGVTTIKKNSKSAGTNTKGIEKVIEVGKVDRIRSILEMEVKGKEDPRGGRGSTSTSSPRRIKKGKRRKSEGRNKEKGIVQQLISKYLLMGEAGNCYGGGEERMRKECVRKRKISGRQETPGKKIKK